MCCSYLLLYFISFNNKDLRSAEAVKTVKFDKTIKICIGFLLSHVQDVVFA